MEREAIMAEVWHRMSNVTGVFKVDRNPSKPPSMSDLPVIHLFDQDDTVISRSSRGGYPIYTREFTLHIATYIIADNNSSASQELGLFIIEIKKKLYLGGTTLGKTCCDFSEVLTTPYKRPPISGDSIGVGLKFIITYLEDIGNYMIGG